jgi:DNA-binding NarL/FixJ family response regulator
MSVPARDMPEPLSGVISISDARGLRNGAIAVAVVADDERLARRVEAALRREGMVADVEPAGERRLAVDRLTRLPDIVVLGGVAALGPAAASEVHRVRRRLPEAHVVLVVDDSAVGHARHLLDAGVDGVVLAGAVGRTLALVVRAACEGYVSVPRSMRHGVDLPALSFRERQILALVVAGLTNDEIAGRLYLAETTIKGHLTSAFRRLGVRSRREAVALILAADESLRRSVLSAVPGADEPDGSDWGR